MRIAIVNDMPMAVEGLRRLIAATGTHQVAWTALNGADAVTACRKDVPDLILMDIIMPGMNGAETTRQIMHSSPCPILLVTSSVNSNSSLVFEAMGYGALDAINTPVLTARYTDRNNEPLLKKIAMLNALSQTMKPALHLQKKDEKGSSSKLENEAIIVIGSSSGGPQALAALLQEIPGDFPTPIVIVQHVDEQFAIGLADWLSTLSNIPVRIAKEGERPKPGTVFLAGSRHHLVLSENGCFHYTPNPKETPYRPSVDVFWNSLEKHWMGRVTAILLTGMGKDGAESMLKLRQSGAYTIAQDEQSCAVYGMPKAAVALGAAVDILPIDKIANSLLKKY